MDSANSEHRIAPGTERTRPGPVRQALAIARFTVLEAVRTRLLLLALAALVLAWAGSLFLHQVAVTETARVQAAVFAAAARLISVFVLALYLISSVVRELNDKGLELLLSLDLPRGAWLAGRYLGFAAVGCGLAALACAGVAMHAPAPVALVWGASLALELMVVAAASLFCVVTFSQVMPATLFVTAFYLLSRAIGAMRLMAESSLLGALEQARPALALVTDAIAYLLPALDRFTHSAWVADAQASPSLLPGLVLQALAYTGVLLAAAAFDLYRREL